MLKKKMTMVMMVLVPFCWLMQLPDARAQSVEVQQLLLDVKKLAQFKQILKDLQTGYSVLNKGYSTIKGIAEGNFSLHEAFIDGLLLVNPTLAKYRRGADIISDELTIVSQYKAAYTYFKSSGRFSVAELDYLSKVYRNLMDKGVDNLDALATVLTSGELRMTDGERLSEINRLYQDTHQMLTFLMGFNERVSILSKQRLSGAVDLGVLKKLQDAGPK